MKDFEFLTTPQLNRKIQAMAKNWLKERKYNDVTVNCIRGTFHTTNASNYMMSAKYILEQATGMQFRQMTASMTRLISEQTN